MGVLKKKRNVSWCRQTLEVLKFDVAEAAQGKLGLAGIGGKLRNQNGEALYIISKHDEIKDSNQAEVLAILEAVRIYSSSFLNSLIVKSDLANTISWVNSLRGPWKIQFLFNEIHHLMSLIRVSFQHISRPANGMADCLAKQGVESSCNLSANVM